MLRPLSPNTEAQYKAAIERGLSDSEASRKLLRAALKRQALELGQDPEIAIQDVPPRKYEVRRIREFMSEDHANAYEAAARRLIPGRRAMALLPLALGLRASSLLGLERKNVERGAETGALKVLLKRGKEDLIPCAKAQRLLGELLEVPAAQTRAIKAQRPHAWKIVGEILSPGKPNSQYRILHDLVQGLGREIGIQDLSPHDLRHAFASRMMREPGATIADVQRALGHESMQTTLIYLHADRTRVGQFMREF